MNSTEPNNPWTAIIFTSLIGIDLLICVSLGYLLGNWLSELTNGSIVWIISGLLTGIIVSVLSIISLIKHYGVFR